MKEIQIQEVGLKNFGGYNGGLVLPFVSGKLILITGPNGSGKTTLFDAMSYALYGKTTKGGTGEDVINNEAKRNCKCWVKFAIDGQDYTVVRYVKYSRLGNTVHLLDGNDNVIKKGHREIVPYLDQIFMPYKLFMNTLMFTQKVKDFFTDLNDSDQKEIFRKILLLDEYLTYQKTASSKLKRSTDLMMDCEHRKSINNELLDQIQKQITKLINQKIDFETNKKIVIEELNNQIKQVKKDIVKCKSILNDYEKMELDRQSDDLTRLSSAIKSQLDYIKNEVSNSIENIYTRKRLKEQELQTAADNKANELKSNHQQEVKNFELERNNITLSFTNLTNKIDREYETKIQESNLLYNEKKLLISQLEEYEESLKLEEGAICPTCKQVLSSECISHINEKVEQLNDKIDQLSNNAKYIETKAREDTEKRLDALKTKRDSDNKKLVDNFNAINTEYKNKLSDIKNRLKTVLSTVETLSEEEIKKVKETGISKTEKLAEEEIKLDKSINTLNDKIEQRDNIIQELNKVENNLNILNDRLSEKQKSEFDESMIDDLDLKRQKLTNDNIEIDNEYVEYKRLIELYGFWKHEGFSSSGIPSMLIDESIPFMNQKVSEYSEMIAGGRYIISFDTLKATKDGKEFKDKINVEVFDTKTKSDKRVKFSGGQTRIVDIATILTLRDLQSKFQNVKINLLLFDEIFDSLDDENIGYVSKLLKNLAKELCIVIISHRHFDSIESDEILRIGG